MAFADHYPLETFASIADAAWWRASDWRREEVKSDDYRAAVAADTEDRKRIDAHQAIFKVALEAHLTDLRNSGKLGKANGLGGREITLAEAWNNFVDNAERDYKFSWLLDSISKLWTSLFVRMDEHRYTRTQAAGYVNGTHNAPSDEMIVKTWTEICKQFDEGVSITDSSRFSYWEIEANDSVSGDRCYLHFHEWQAVVMMRNKEYDLVPICDIPEMQNITANFEVPTGKLMITDVLREKHFIEGTEFGAEREYGELSLNNGHGRNKRIIANAEEHDIGYVQTTNTCVAVFKDELGRLIVTERWNNDLPSNDEEELIFEGWKQVGTFSCDVWCVTAFDKSIALERMKEGGSESAEGDLRTYLESKDCYADNIVHLEVEPGTWAIHGGEKFSETVDREAKRLPELVHIWCLFEKI